MTDELSGFATPEEAAEWDRLLAEEAAATPISAPATIPTAALERLPPEAFTVDVRDFNRVIAARRMELGFSSLEIDDLAGLASGHTSKIECGTRNLGLFTLPCLMDALGLRIAMVRVEPHKSTVRARDRLTPKMRAARSQLWASKKRTAEETAAKKKAAAERNNRRRRLQQAAAAGPFAN